MLPREHYLKQTFQDAVNFPEGFEKGGLSDIQARLVRKHGALINAITQEEVSDATTEDVHILKVIANQSVPKNPIEQAWIKYISIVKARQAAAPTKPPKTRAAKIKPAESTDTPPPAKTVKKPKKTEIS
jgi:uncharacterized protein YifE (UPF0438 family)